MKFHYFLTTPESIFSDIQIVEKKTISLYVYILTQYSLCLKFSNWLTNQKLLKSITILQPTGEAHNGDFHLNSH